MMSPTYKFAHFKRYFAPVANSPCISDESKMCRESSLVGQIARHDGDDYVVRCRLSLCAWDELIQHYHSDSVGFALRPFIDLFERISTFAFAGVSFDLFRIRWVVLWSQSKPFSSLPFTISQEMTWRHFVCIFLKSNYLLLSLLLLVRIPSYVGRQRHVVAHSCCTTVPLTVRGALLKTNTKRNENKQTK